MIFARRVHRQQFEYWSVFPENFPENYTNNCLSFAAPCQLSGTARRLKRKYISIFYPVFTRMPRTVEKEGRGRWVVRARGGKVIAWKLAHCHRFSACHELLYKHVGTVFFGSWRRQWWRDHISRKMRFVKCRKDFYRKQADKMFCLTLENLTKSNSA